MVLCGALDCSWERATDTRSLSRHRASCLSYKKSSVLATKKRQERVKEAAFANLAAADLPKIGRPRPIAPRRSLGRQRGGSAALTFNPTSPVASQGPLYIPRDDIHVDVEMDINCGDEIDLEVLGTRPMRRIPRLFNDIEPLEEDLNHSDNADKTLFRPPSTHTFIPSSLLARTCPAAAQETDSLPKVFAPPWPFPNMTTYRLISWMNSGSSRVSESKVAALVKDVMLAEDFDREHLQKFSIKQSLRELDKDESGKRIVFPDDWIETTVTIDIPTKVREDSPRPYTIPGFHYRPLVEVIRTAFADAQARAFHLLPFKRIWKDPLDDHQERIYDELYTSDAWLEAQDDLHKLPKESGCSLERVIAGLMFFSDATHLANFGTAKAWPLYAYFGNLTKYVRSSPTSGSCHLIGFLPSLPDAIKDILSNLPRISKTGMASLHTHCCRELFHVCWMILLDEEFLYVYRHGIVLKCADGVMRRVYPRIFTYSADYPEKALIATIKDMGACTCPRCLIPKALFDCLGLAKDMKSRIANLRAYASTKVVQARQFIFQWGNMVDGARVGDILGAGSWVPILNQFAEKLGPLGLDPFRMLVVDLMHECELGTWKALFTHLIRLLYALPGGTQLVATLDSRFRQVPTFGNRVIHKFANNTSEMKRLAARDFEDILQCAIPVFEGLFPSEHDSAVQSLLYQFAQWHALAKLRIHSGSTLAFFEDTFNKLARKLRRFRACTCTAFVTTELPKEKAARQRRLAQHSEINIASQESTRARTKKFNLNTYKFHAMGDYLRTIKHFGTTDSFTTQIGELAHRALKAFYPLTSKLDTPAQLVKHERRRRVLRRVAEAGATSPPISQPPVADAPSSNKHHHITTSQNHPVALFMFLRQHENDPALKKFILKLRDHVLYRLRKLDISYCDHAFTPEERNSVIIPNDMIYSVQTMQVNYTTYDMRRESDTINPRAHADIMVLSGETTPNHPYWYARVLGIYHTETWLNDGGRPVKQHLEFLWVRWLAPLRNHKFGIKYARLPKVAFVEESDTDAFGFLDPGQVIRGIHLIPAFASGRGASSFPRGKSLARPGGELDDWEMYYVGIFVDRDMFIRYTHFGIGHPVTLRKIIRDCLDFEPTGDTMDIESITNEEIDVGYEENGASDSCDGYSDDDDEEEEEGEEGEEEEEEELGDEELEDEGNEDWAADEDGDGDDDLLSF
ncbi:hypothetical protein BDR06DRAFT_1012728 [Suillus hirtellus]|nr:hypothetical protein BDR06DRAFT_1012728 [Suillus hirtellus]